MESSLVGDCHNGIGCGVSCGTRQSEVGGCDSDSIQRCANLSIAVGRNLDDVARSTCQVVKDKIDRHIGVVLDADRVDLRDRASVTEQVRE